MATTYSDVITTSLLPDSMRVIYSNELEYTAQGNLVFDQFAEVKTEFGLDRGQQVVWTVYRNLPPAIAALTENVDVDGASLSDFQVSLTVNEYGYAIGTTEKIDLLSYHGKISNIVQNSLAPHMATSMDVLARNAAWAGAPKRFAGNATSRATIDSADVATIATVKQAAFALARNRVRPVGSNYVCVCHPAVIYDLKEDSEWKDAGVYSDPSRLMTGEVGMIHGVRFVESHIARLPNAGTAGSPIQTVLTAIATTNTNVLTVTSSTGFTIGDEITLYAAAQSLPDGTDPGEEYSIIASMTATTITLEQKLLRDHASGSKVRLAEDIYPLMFLGADKPYGKGLVVSPEVRVAMPTDKLGRIHYVGWYSLLGYGVLRNWTYLVVEAAASQSGQYVFGW